LEYYIIMFTTIKKIDFELTTICNSKCKYCLRTIYGTDSHMLDIQIIKKKLKNILNTVEEIKLCGSFGDCIFYPNLIELLDFLSIYSIQNIYFVTNASIGSISLWKKLATYPNLKIIFALDGLKDSHEYYRKGIVFENVINNIKVFINKGGNATAQMLLFKHNENEVYKVKELVENIGGSIYYRVSRKYDEEFQKPTKFLKTFFKTNKSENKVYCRHLIEKHIYISANGYVYPCCNFQPEALFNNIKNIQELKYYFNFSKSYMNIYNDQSIIESINTKLFKYVRSNVNNLNVCSTCCNIPLFEKFFDTIPE